MSLTQIQLRPATTADLEAILTLERATANAPHWPPATYAEIVATQNTNNPQRCLIVAHTEDQKDQITGFAVGLINRTESTAELETVAVAASARRTGIGRALCTAVLGWCREQGAISIVLEVRASSADAIALYTQLGFVSTGRRPRYYRDPEDDALILHLQEAPR
jgi:[ribosomal protein S18]-alanine N-acetyltransferase